jgi:hypothetical protein
MGLAYRLKRVRVQTVCLGSCVCGSHVGCGDDLGYAGVLVGSAV